MKRIRVCLPTAVLCLSICMSAISCEKMTPDVETEADTEICSQVTQELQISELLFAQ